LYLFESAALLNPVVGNRTTLPVPHHLEPGSASCTFTPRTGFAVTYHQFRTSAPDNFFVCDKFQENFANFLCTTGTYFKPKRISTKGTGK